MEEQTGSILHNYLFTETGFCIQWPLRQLILLTKGADGGTPLLNNVLQNTSSLALFLT